MSGAPSQMDDNRRETACPLVLASRSHTRRRLLEAAKIRFELGDCDVDERLVETEFSRAGGAVSELSSALARAKALQASANFRDRYCLAAEQTLLFEGAALHKAPTLAAARAQLLKLAGKTHVLSSAFAISLDGSLVHEGVDCAELTMRRMTERDIDDYLAVVGPQALASVGAYQFEGFGVHLFEQVSGSYFTILGLPLLPLVGWLRQRRLGGN